MFWLASQHFLDKVHIEGVGREPSDNLHLTIKDCIFILYIKPLPLGQPNKGNSFPKLAVVTAGQKLQPLLVESVLILDT